MFMIDTSPHLPLAVELHLRSRRYYGPATRRGIFGLNAHTPSSQERILRPAVHIPPAIAGETLDYCRDFAVGSHADE